MAQISEAFLAFQREAPEHAGAWRRMIADLNEASELDPKTRELAFISVLAALNRVSGIPFHVASAKKHGASRGEVVSAVMLGLPLAGHVVTQSIPEAVRAFDSES